MTNTEQAEWRMYLGESHAFYPEDRGFRDTYCDEVPAPVPVEDVEPLPDTDPGEPQPVMCTGCIMALGTKLAKHHGARVHRAKDPDSV